MLKVEGIAKSFRGLKAITNASFHVPRGAIVALIGPRGLGKTSIAAQIALAQAWENYNESIKPWVFNCSC